MKKNKIKKVIGNLLFFILLIILTFYIILKDQDFSKIFEILANVKLRYVLIGIGCMCVYLTCEAINVKRVLRTLNEDISLFKSIKYAFIGFFFSSITPAASGGQPMEIYYMHKEKVSVANSTLALLVNLSSFQIVTISLALISIIFNYGYLNTQLIIFFIIGISLNLMALSLLIIAIFSKRLLNGLINIAVKILKFFRIKNIDSKKEKLENELKKYEGSSVYIRTHKTLIIRTILTSIVQFLIYYSIPYWVYKAFDLGEYNVFQVISMQAVLYATVSGIPSPGAVGVSEGGFLTIFRNAFSKDMISSAMLLNRGISFYSFVLFSGLVVIINALTLKDNDNIIENEELETINSDD